MSTPTISIIVPVYNVEQYLTRCLDSIAQQTFKDIEVLLIDDGSTDKSGLICEQFCIFDSRFQVIHQENQGLSNARNTGLSISLGEYIAFVDGDDYIHPQMIELLYNVLVRTKCTLSMSMGIRTNINDKIKTSILKDIELPIDIIDQNTIIQRLFGLAEKEIQYQVVWNKLYPKELIKNFKFNNTSSEDTDFNIRIYLSCHNMAIINIPMYYWIQRSTSITHQINLRYIDNIKSYNQIYKYIPYNNTIYRGYCLFKLYKRMLNIRYWANKITKYKFYTNHLINNIKHDTFSDFITNKNISFFKKIYILIFLYIPCIYNIYMNYCNYKQSILKK